MKYLLNDRDINAIIHGLKPYAQGLAFDARRVGVRPSFCIYRYKLLEAMGATTANKANAAIYYLGGTTDVLQERDFVNDDSSELTNASSGYKGVCVATSAYYALAVQTQPFKLGVVVNATIGSSSTGQVDLCTDGWVQTSQLTTVKNYHDIDLEVGTHVRWASYPGWTYPVVELFDWSYYCT